MNQYAKETLSVHSGTLIDRENEGANSPVYTSTSYGYLDKETPMYPRYFNTQNQQAVAEKIRALENGESGLVFSSGMAAITSTLYAYLSQGDHIVFQSALYGGTLNFILRDLNRFGIEYTLVNSTYVKDFEKAVKENTRAIYIETPSNPLLRIIDMEEIARLAKSKNILTIMDNTFASPVNQNPIDWWIDIVVHSATKYLNGHSDVTAGAVVSTRDRIDRIWETARNLGGSLNAQICYLLERSLKTLRVRVKTQNKNALQVARHLESHKKIQKVWYPGLESHVGHEIAQKQMRGFGGMLSFEPASDSIIAFQQKLELIRPAVSLGGIDSTICSPMLTSHKGLSQEEREEQGISDSMLRLSIGIEHPDDLIRDLDRALEKI